MIKNKMMLRTSSALVRQQSTRSTILPVDQITTIGRFMSSQSQQNEPSSFFSQLRLQAANALTSSLKDRDREALLQKLDAVSKKELEKKIGQKEEIVANDSVQYNKTIGEAIAAAKIEEAKRIEAKWERERENIQKQAEEAVLARVENDLRIQERRVAMERWQRELELEKSQEAQQTIDEPETSTSNVETQTTEDKELHHPLLGPVLVELEYKRIHLVSAKDLASIPVWKKQRIYRHQRAKVMAKDKLKTPSLGFPGIISLHESDDGQLSILDGQHRVGMMTILQEKGNDVDIDMEKVLVEVFNDSPSHNAQDIFLEINKSEPVKMIDTPGLAKSSDRNIITEAAALLEAQYSEMFKPSQRCRPPHLNIDNLRDALFKADLIEKHNIKSSKQMIEWILSQNKMIKDKFEKEGLPSTINQRAYEKAKKFDFFLGLDFSWLYL